MNEGLPSLITQYMWQSIAMVLLQDCQHTEMYSAYGDLYFAHWMAATSSSCLLVVPSTVIQPQDTQGV